MVDGAGTHRIQVGRRCDARARHIAVGEAHSSVVRSQHIVRQRCGRAGEVQVVVGGRGIGAHTSQGDGIGVDTTRRAGQAVLLQHARTSEGMQAVAGASASASDRIDLG